MTSTLRHRLLIALCALLLTTLAPACGEDDSGGDPGPTDTSSSSGGDASSSSGVDTSSSSGGDASSSSGGDASSSSGMDATDAADMVMLPPHDPEDCDPLDPTICALPWPSNKYLVADAARGTGYTLTFGETTLPENGSGVHIDPAPYQRMDGYGLGVPIMVTFPDLDVSALPDETNPAASLDPDAAIVLLQVNADGSVERVPYWVELDAYSAGAPEQLLFVRPAVILEEGTRHVVAFRGLTDTAGSPIPASEAFTALAAGGASDPMLAPRQARFDEVFTILEAEGIPRDDLTLAWDFVTASSDGLHRYMLDVIDKGFTAAGPDGPALTVTSVQRFVPVDDGSGLEVHEHTALRVEGTFEAPHFMREVPVIADGSIGWVFNFGADGMPEQDGTRTATFWLNVPHTALDGTPHGLMLYGHGLLGEGRRAHASFNSKIAFDHNLFVFGADLVGMAEVDYSNVIDMLKDFSFFPLIADRLHQGMLEYHLLTRAMKMRFDELAPQIQAALGEVDPLPLVANPDEVFYSGISQGGIFGGTFMATSPDVTYGHLGVPGNNYSTLLHRSVDFTDFFNLLRAFYRDPIDQSIALAGAQLLWDGTDPVSYLRHVTAEPFEGNDPHYVILAPAKGDWQVSVLTNEVVASSDIGIPLMTPYDVERSPSLAATQAYPYSGSGVVLYDFGNPWPPAGNTPPDDNGVCREDFGEVCDPHELPRRRDWHNDQMVHFFRNSGEIIDVCGGDGCTPD